MLVSSSTGGLPAALVEAQFSGRALKSRDGFTGQPEQAYHIPAAGHSGWHQSPARFTTLTGRVDHGSRPHPVGNHRGAPDVARREFVNRSLVEHGHVGQHSRAAAPGQRPSRDSPTATPEVKGHRASTVSLSGRESFSHSGIPAGPSR